MPKFLTKIQCPPQLQNALRDGRSAYQLMCPLVCNELCKCGRHIKLETR